MSGEVQPEFLSFDEKHREALLSQLGTFSHSERDAFHKLCLNWQPKIPYERFAAVINRGDISSSSDIVSLMDKLKRRRVGLIRTEIRDGERHRAYIVLTNQHNPRFYRELVDEYFVDMIESITNPFPFLSTIKSEFDSIPPGVFHVVTADEIAGYYSGDITSDTALAIPVLDDEQILISSHFLKPFLNLSILKMRHHLSSTSLLGVLAKSLDSSLLSLKEKIAAKDPSFWHQFCSTVVEKRKDLAHNRNVSVSPLFFHAAWIVKTLVEAQLAEVQKKKRIEQEHELDLEAISLAIKEAPDGLVASDQLERMLEAQKDKYEDTYEDFRESFFTSYVQAQGRISLSKIVDLDGRYIHRDNIFPMFLERFHECELELKSEYVLRMERSLRGNTRKPDSAFLSVENFEETIASSVRVHSVFLAALIDKPAVLAEAMILHAKQNKLAKDVNELKERLSLYFDPETLKPLPLRDWFNLRLTEIFEYAFERLPILRRIWIRLTGKYDSLRNKYVGSGVSNGKLPLRTYERSKPITGGVEPRRPVSASSRRPSTERSQRRKAKTENVTRKTRRSKPKTEPVKRPYSKKQIETAWDSFSDVIRKDPE